MNDVAPDTQMRRILMIEDLAEDRQIYRRYLKRHFGEGIAWREAETAAEGLAEIEQWSPDCVLLDYSLPDQDGLAVLQSLLGERARLPLPVVMLTGMGSESIAVQALKLGAMDYLVKDHITANALKRTVLNAMEKHNLVAELENSRGALERSHAELEARNADLRASKLELEREVGERRQVQQTLLESEKHFRKMAEFSASVIHNLGNVLTNMGTSIFQMRSVLEGSQLRNMLLAHGLIRDHLEDFDRFIVDHPKGKLLPKYLLSSGEHLQKEQERLNGELDLLNERLLMMRDIIEQQQTRAKDALKSNPLDLGSTVDKVVSLNEELIETYQIQVFTQHFATRPVFANRAKILQILINLVKNAIEAMAANPPDRHRHLILRTSDENHDRICLEIRDTGCGIEPEQLTNLFAYGYSTKKEGHGFGLPYCALAMKEMGGDIRATSEGVGRGTAFTLTFRSGRKLSHDGK
ncbi:ATP-binding protein [Acanthopleuribacter pedis]|uniref:histidine kinase n=1 Tax=Acanthopleuribacter pedis TaxID=442870 RepID=A0A8J7QAE5_9BACT|nr:ATP-binding protein [Acanthopleuribacter pedis]MBO1321766.1 response regulator [Acanthopleuribacter pedis]